MVDRGKEIREEIGGRAKRVSIQLCKKAWKKVCIARRGMVANLKGYFTLPSDMKEEGGSAFPIKKITDHIV